MKRSIHEIKFLKLRQALLDLQKAYQVSDIIVISEYKKVLDLKSLIGIKLKEVREDQIRKSL